jgi:integrase
LTAYARRYQRGWLRRRGSDWLLTYRLDEPDPVTGRMNRRRRTEVIGTHQELRTDLAARAVATAIMDRITGRQMASGTALAASKYVQKYLAERVVLMRPSTQKTVRSRIHQHLLPLLRTVRLDQVNASLAQRLITTMAKAGSSPHTVRQTVKLLRAILRAARHEGYAAEVFDSRSVRYPSHVKARARRKVFTAEELGQLLGAAAFPWRAAYGCGAYLGLRCGETLGLDWSDVDLERRTVRIRQSAVIGHLQALKTTRSAATLPLPTELAEILTAYHEACGRPADGLLFPSTRGTAMQSSVYRRALSRELARLGLAHRGTHAFRHTAASLLLSRGAAVSSVRDLLRHSDVKQTDTYSHTISQDLRDVASQMTLQKPETITAL